MDRAIFDRILQSQEDFRSDPEYRCLLQEYEQRNVQLIGQLETMTEKQRSAVLDYCGVLIELQYKMLESTIKYNK